MVAAFLFVQRYFLQEHRGAAGWALTVVALTSASLGSLGRCVAECVAAACGGVGATSAPERRGGSGDDQLPGLRRAEELQAYRDVITAFEDVEPDIDVQLVEASDRDDLIARLSTSFAGGSPPDLFLLNYRFYGQFAARGVLEPIEDRLDDVERVPEETSTSRRSRHSGSTAS